MYRIESFFRGDDYRISVLDGEVICAYQRIPLSIVGNGIDTIQTLLQLQQNLFDTNNRDVDTALNIESIISKLRCNHYTLDTILEAGKQIYLLDNANLST
jgi:D-alanine-D-alanine ligase-like ATP-grasp enzyme